MFNQNEYFKDYYQKHKEKILEHNRKWWKENNYSVTKKKYNKEWREKYGAENGKRYYHSLKDKTKFRANWAVYSAVKRGILIRQPCEICGEDKTDGHHYDGYEPEKYLTIRWLCRQHHTDAHKNL